MFRYDVINIVANINKAVNYLEIGIQNGICFNKVKIENKVGVDPYPIFKDPRVLEITSDEFFNKNTEKFDVIFIDGLHTYEQVKKDYENSLKWLNKGGFIVFHDMNPTTEERATSFSEGGQWNGDCYKLAIDLYNEGYEFFTSIHDQGCLVFNNLKGDPRKKKIGHSYTEFDANRELILNLTR